MEGHLRLLVNNTIFHLIANLLLSFLSLCLGCLPIPLPDQSVCELKIFHLCKVQMLLYMFEIFYHLPFRIVVRIRISENIVHIKYMSIPPVLPYHSKASLCLYLFRVLAVSR